MFVTGVRRVLFRSDQNIAKYKVKIRGMKWYSSFIGYVIDAALNNAWQLHRICCHDAQVDLLAFRRYVACVYLESNADTSSQGRRSRRLETESRFDMIGHWIIHQDKRTRCALCHSQTNTRCEKCQKGPFRELGEQCQPPHSMPLPHRPCWS